MESPDILNYLELAVVFLLTATGLVNLFILLAGRRRPSGAQLSDEAAKAKASGRLEGEKKVKTMIAELRQKENLP